MTVPAAYSRLYAVVQWQDGLGDWHDVDGWRGEIEGTRVIWWVGEEHFGTGPFRWLLYDAVGDALGTSAPFMLPANHRHLVRVTVDL